MSDWTEEQTTRLGKTLSDLAGDMNANIGPTRTTLVLMVMEDETKFTTVMGMAVKGDDGTPESRGLLLLAAKALRDVSERLAKRATDLTGGGEGLKEN